jgi:hypothetical protein
MDNYKHSTRFFLGPNEYLLKLIKNRACSAPFEIVQWVPDPQGTHIVGAHVPTDGKAGGAIHISTTFCASVRTPLLHMITAHTARTTDKCYFVR